MSLKSLLKGTTLGFLALLAGVPPAAALDPERAPHQYRLDVWQPENGLPQGSVIALAQTADGYLWLGGYEGLARFDGVSFTVYDRTNTPALGDNNIFDLVEAADGSLWIATDGGGVTRFKDGRFTTWTSADGLAHDRVIVLAAGRDGDVWAGTDGGLSHLRESAITSFTRRDGLPDDSVVALAVDGVGDLWIGTAKGLGRLRDGRITAGDGFPEGRITALGSDRGGHLWVATGGGALARLEDGRFVPRPATGLPAVDVSKIVEDRDGNLWLGTYRAGLVRLREDRASVLGLEDGLTSDLVWALTEDREGSLWLGTEGGGLLRLKDTPLLTLTVRDALPFDRMSVVLEDRDGRLWLGTDGGGLLALASGGKLAAVFTTREGLASNAVTSLHQRRDGSLWVGTLRGMSRLAAGRLTTVAAVPEARIDAILEDRRGTLWIGAAGEGLLRLEGATVTTLAARDGLPGRVRALTEDRRGTLWIGTDSGLARMEDGEIGAVVLADAFVRAIYEDPAGTLWIGTRGSGLARLADGALTVVTSRDGLFNDVIYQILDDGRDLWMSCNKGVFRVGKAEVEALARGEVAAVSSRSYGTADGLKSLEAAGGSQPAGWKTRDGRLWFPTVKGLVLIDPEDLATNRLPPPVHVERLVAGDVAADRHELDEPVTLPPGRGELELHYTALSFLDPDKVRFKFRLEGYDGDWIDAGTRRSAYYTNLSPGSYRFRVIASNDDGVWNETGDAVELYLRPAFYQTWTFYVACALAAAFGIRGLHGLRLRRLVRRNEELRRIQGELERKNAEVEAKSAEMQRFTYAVSHDLRSPLITIKGFLRFVEAEIAHGELDKAAADLQQMKKAATKMEQMLDELLELSRVGEVVRSTEPVDLGEVAREAVELVAGRLDARGVEVGIAADLPPVVGDRPRLLQVMQNLIDNAVKFMGPQAEPKIEIGCVSAERGEAVCYVRDNGLGIAAVHQQKIFDLFDQVDGRAEGTGMGLALVKRVIEVHGGRIWVESEGEGRGSTFFFALPAAAI